MGLNYKKRIKVAPGVHVNVGKKSVGVSVGGKRAGVSVNSKTGATVRASVPGTGVSYRKNLSGGAHTSAQGSDGLDNVAAGSTSAGTLEEPTYLADDAVQSLNQEAFMEYSKAVLDYCKQLSPDTDPETFKRAQSALHTVNAELQRRGADAPNAKPVKENPLDKLTPERKAKNRKLCGVAIGISAVAGLLARAVGADVLMVFCGILLILSVVAFVKNK